MVATPMVVVQVVAKRRALDLAGFVRLTAGRIPGTALGACVLTLAGAARAFALVRGLP